jgi:PKHD-type hydroxylase
MLIHIRQVLAQDQVKEMLRLLDEASWSDGRETAGYLSARVKNNAQLPETEPLARQLGGMVLDALDRHAQFRSAALPLRIIPPLFNRYSGGQTHGEHIDGALRPVPGSRLRVRTALSATLFLSAPETYDGGELVIKDSLGERRVKLPPGDMVLYPGTTIHSVMPVTRGTRLASFFWIQSAVRENEKRALLYELDGVVQELGATPSAHAQSVRLAGIYHNLVRFWADS